MTTRPTVHVAPVRGCRCPACRHALVAHEVAAAHAQAERAARRDALMTQLDHLADYLDGLASVRVGAAATAALIDLLGTAPR